MPTQVDIPSIVKYETLSSLLAAALADARRIRDACDPQIRLDMSNWMRIDWGSEGNICFVCLAGSMLVGHVTYDQAKVIDTRRSAGTPFAALRPSDFANKTMRYMRAIDACRDGDLLYALVQFTGRSGEDRSELETIAIRIRDRVREAKHLQPGQGLGYAVRCWPSFELSPDLWWETMDELVKQLAEAGQ